MTYVVHYGLGGGGNDYSGVQGKSIVQFEQISGFSPQKSIFQVFDHQIVSAFVLSVSSISGTIFGKM